MPHRVSLGVGIGLGVAGLVVVAALGGLLLVGGAGGGDPAREDRSAPRAEAESTTTEPPSQPETAPPTRGSADPVERAEQPDHSVLGPRVTLAATDDASDLFLPVPPVVDELEPDTVLQVTVLGFGWFSTARASQCVTTTTRSCGNTLAVQFSEDGSAQFQYLVSTDFAPSAAKGGCRLRGASCSIVVEEIDGEHRAEITTVFQDEVPPPGRLRVTPRSGLVDGEEVEVSVAGLPPESEVVAVVCAASESDGGASCEPLGPQGAMSVRRDGGASATVPIATENIGPEELDCSRDRPCAVTVVAEAALVRVPAVRIGLAVPPGADYDTTQLALGLGAALTALALATYLVRRTDWSPIGEAAAPEIDNAEYADLDAIVAALPPEPEPEDVMASSGRRRR